MGEETKLATGSYASIGCGKSNLLDFLKNFCYNYYIRYEKEEKSDEEQHLLRFRKYPRTEESSHLSLLENRISYIIPLYSNGKRQHC